MSDNDIDALLSAAPHLVMKIIAGSLTIEETEFLIEKLGKVQINIGDGLTLLHQAAQANADDVVELLCSKGHPLEVKTVSGETPLDQAAWKGAFHAAAVLIRHGADVDTQTVSGYTPLHRCAFYDHHQLASFLCLAGADQKLKDQKDMTAYDCAVEQSNPKLIQLLTPMINSDGSDITGIAYATNNPKHPNFRPEAREALFALFDINSAAENK